MNAYSFDEGPQPTDLTACAVCGSCVQFRELADQVTRRCLPCDSAPCVQCLRTTRSAHLIQISGLGKVCHPCIAAEASAVPADSPFTSSSLPG